MRWFYVVTVAFSQGMVSSSGFLSHDVRQFTVMACGDGQSRPTILQPQPRIQNGVLNVLCLCKCVNVAP